MGARSVQSKRAWVLARRQHWTITDEQLEELEFTRKAIRHRLRTGRLRKLWPDVYAVGPQETTPQGWWMAAVLTCGEGACLSHDSANQNFGTRPTRPGPIHVSVPSGRRPRRKGIKVHRRTLDPGEITTHSRIPTTVPLIALLDLAHAVGRKELERAIGEADRLGLISPDELRAGAEAHPGRPGAGRLKKTLDRHTFVLTHTELERRFVAIVKRVGLPLPDGQWRMGGIRVDFIWTDLGLVVETDGLTYHRTAAQQSEDLARDHASAARGLLTLRFSHAHVRYEPEHVQATLAAVAARVRADGSRRVPVASRPKW